MSALPKRGLHILRPEGEEKAILDFASERPADSIVQGADRTTCPHCKGTGVQRSTMRTVIVACDYCDGIRTVTLDDARVYLRPITWH